MSILLIFLKRNITKINFLVWEIILLCCFALIKEMAGGSTTSGILYKLFPKVIIIERGLESYTTCFFHKYGWPNNTSDTSRGETSHNNSYVKGLILYGKQKWWLMRRSLPWWSHPMVYDYGCVVVGRPSHFTTSAEMRFFWVPLRNSSGEPFTHICEWKRRSPSSGSSGSSLWSLVVEKMALGSASMLFFPFSYPLSTSF